MQSWASSEMRAAGCAGLSALLLLATFGLSLGNGNTRLSAVAAAAVFALLVATGLALYAWRLGAPGRSD